MLGSGSQSRPVAHPSKPESHGSIKEKEEGARQGGGGGNGDWMPEFVATASNVTCLYPCEGNYHAFVSGPHGAAVLDVLFPPYNKGNSRVCTYYKRRAGTEEEEYNGDDDHIDGGWGRPLVVLMPIDARQLQLPGRIIWSLQFGLKK